MLDAVVLAGSPNSGPLRECSKEVNEALITVGDRPMIRYVVEALLQSECIRKVVIAGPSIIKEMFPDEAVEVVEANGTVLENLIRAFSAVNRTRRVLVAACDIPLLTPGAVDDFVRQCREDDIDFFYPIVPMVEIKERFPAITRTSVKLQEGTFTGGNLFIINPEAVARCAPLAENFIYHRKSPIHLCRLLGLKFVLKFLVNRLSIPELEKKVSELLGIKGRAVVTAYPEIGIDVDKPSDYSIVSAYLDRPA